MSHCAPEATLKPKRFQFTLKTVITVLGLGGCSKDVTRRLRSFYRQTCIVRPWNSTRSVGGRAESTSWTFRNQLYVVSQVRRCLAGQRRVNETCQLEVDTSLGRKPVQLTKNWRDVVPSSGSGEKPSGGILDGLNFADKALGQAVQQ